jgi:enoyl-[acyl-carrier protein] reductase II
MGALGALAGPELIGAVSEAGGLGLISTVALDAKGLSETIARTREITDKPIGANLMALNPESPGMIEVLAAEGVKVVTVSAGSPNVLTETLHGAGFTVLHVVPSPGLALKAKSAGVDAVVAEGSESGGMQSKTAITMACLVPQVIDAVDIPVVAAGGIYDARGYAAAFALGARGVQIGTRLILTEECPAHPEYKRALLESGPEDTLVVPMSVGPLRVLNNGFIRGMTELDETEKTQMITEAWAGFNVTCLEGNVEDTLVMTGQCTGAIKEILPAGEVVRRMAENGGDIIRRFE